MDPSRFDALARSLTTRLGRRTVLHTVGAGLAALALMPAPHDAGAAKKKKKSRKEKERELCRRKFGPGIGTYCRGFGCFDLLTDPAHCAACGNACAAGQACANGSCVSASCTPNCAGQACGAPNGCGGVCTVGSCPAGQACSSEGVCVAGNCNPPCGYNTTCQNTTCVPQPNRCPTPFVCAGFGGDAPVCGMVAGAGGGTCGCYLSTEGNTICVNQTDADGDDIDYTELTPCTSSQTCREQKGFNWYCRAVTRNSSNQICGSTSGRCWPTCDNPSI